MTREEAKSLLAFTLGIVKISHELDNVTKDRKVRDDFWEGYHKGMVYAAQMVADEITKMIEGGEV